MTQIIKIVSYDAISALVEIISVTILYLSFVLVKDLSSLSFFKMTYLYIDNYKQIR